MVDRIAVSGATGNVGHEVVLRLLARGARVVAIARDASKLERLARRGAEVRSGSLEDAGFVSGALADSIAVFAMRPPNRTSDDQEGFARTIAENVARAVRGSSVRRVVSLSAAGIDLGIENAHRIFEETLDQVPNVATVHLRPSLFMESLLAQIDLIRGKGETRSFVAPDFALPLVAATDIGAVAADYLAAPDLDGRRVRYLLGPRDVTMTEATRILGDAIGIPDLRYVPFTEAELRERLQRSGCSNRYVEDYVRARNAYNREGRGCRQTRSAESSTPTTIEEFATNVFAAAFRARSAS
jgi:uncharacterized protein YbjT (DUF2867 family)